MVSFRTFGGPLFHERETGRELLHVDKRENRLRESLQTFITLHKARAVYHWEVGADAKLYPDSALGNSLKTGYLKRSQK